MITTILVILFGSFTIVNTIRPPCGNNSNCKCSLTSLDDIKMVYNKSMDLEIIVNVKSWDKLEVICKGTKQLEDFKYISNPPGKKINSLSIRSCVLSDITSLKKFAKKLGIVESKTLSFQSFKKSNRLLTKEHLNGIANVTELILSHNNLLNVSSDIFEDLRNLEKLDMSHNNLTVLPRAIFDVTRYLKYIQLSKNAITTIEFRYFFSLDCAEHMDFGDNNLRDIHKHTFNLMDPLKILIIKANNLNNIDWGLFYTLILLETIDISYNNLLRIEQQIFYQNKDLRRIFFHNNNISLITLPENLFLKLQKLEEVYLNNDGLLYLPERFFWNSPLLKCIHLENNLITYLRETTFKGLKHLEVLTLGNNLIEILPKKIFKGLRQLKILDLSMNSINSITKGVFEDLKSLTELNMENNRLKYIVPETLSPLRNLSIAKFSNNQLNFDEGGELDTFYFPSNKTLVDLRYNKIYYILMNGTEVSAMYHLKKRDVVILIDHNQMLCDCYIYDLIRYFNDEMPKNVKNFIEINPEELTCKSLDGTISQKIQEINSTTYICPEYQYFKVDNYCQIGCTCSVRPKDKTRILDCSYKNMSQFVIDPTRVNDLGRYPIILNFTGNAFTKIPSVENLYPIKVTGLLISNNHITEILIDQLPKSLTILELHNNSISRIDSHIVKYLNSSSLNELTLSGNPIICDCDAVDLVLFVKLNQHFYEDLNKLKCEDSDVPMYNMSFNGYCSPVIELEEKKELNQVEKNVESEI
ncbi:hypothetical protein M0802_003865 [Mischocyttarus mexicanus]|nr:hypothetical protein M0802_003865 [Mischocyttarus mexicanus]